MSNKAHGHGSLSFSSFETRSASEIGVSSSVESRRGLLDPIFPFCKLVVAAYEFDSEAEAFL
jgi:hypothetical protein